MMMKDFESVPSTLDMKHFTAAQKWQQNTWSRWTSSPFKWITLGERILIPSALRITMHAQVKLILNIPAQKISLDSAGTQSFFFPSDKINVVLCFYSSLHRYRRVCQCTVSERWYLYRSRQRLPVSVCTWLFRSPLSDRWDYSYNKIRLWLNMFTVIISWKLILSLLDSFSDAFSSALIFFVIPAVPTNIYILFFGGVKGK